MQASSNRLFWKEIFFKADQFMDLELEMQRVKVEIFELEIPQKGLEISKVTEDVLKRMLISDTENRI